ncbi:uncharacterized protein C8A04DRAFT_9824 [Dichotomopilus funicola]|uniref:Uncharacterized protein n=1 Tax=Dichotomopilus funicola TaxID=1934379 RepID=A0AAN6V8C0_9PEZI|nr:hypothetical protein C8A04DRAFT_9824 [Dichotomopilus funicola]
MNRLAPRALRAPTLQPLRSNTLPLTFARLALTRPNTRPLSTVAEVSFWKSLVPKPLRTWTIPWFGKSKSKSKSAAKPQGWNPATFFIFIFLFIGSMSIQMISLRKDFATFMRQSDVRIGLLREVVEKLQRGEEVDVEKALGTGDAEKEVLWEQVLKEIEREDAAKSQRKKPAEPAPTTPVKAEAHTEEPRRQMQSTLASKGFF